MASDSGAQAGSSGQTVFYRLVNSLSGRTTPSSPSPAPAPPPPPPTATEEQTIMPTSSPTEPSTPTVSTPALGGPLQRVSSASSSLKKARTKIADRLKQLGKEIGKLRRGNSKSAPASPRVTVGEVTPSTGAGAAERSGHAKLLSMVVEQDEPEGTVRVNATTTATPKRDIPVPKNPSPRSRIVMATLSFLRILPPSRTATSFPSLQPDYYERVDAQRPAEEENAERAASSFEQPGPGTPIATPIPSSRTIDLVEIGEQVPVIVNEVSAPTSWTSIWPLSLWYGNASEVNPPSPETVLTDARTRTSLDGHGRVGKTQTVQAWVPSTTKLSVQALWWGYRLYLPPPVLAILGDQTLEATKRAAMITTALTWFFNNLPVTSLPAPLQPAALLLQRLAPYLGYIGTFISWSWSTIKSYDVGYGVILSATWLLPVALIPSSWKQNDFPTSPSQNTPSPLPPTQTPSSPPTSLPTSPSSASASTTATATPTSLSSVLTSTPSPSSPFAVTPRRVTAQVPVAPTPMEETIPPVPPVPGTPGVPPDSPLGEQLLHGPLISPAPLPEPEDGEDESAPRVEGKKKRGVKSRTKALFMRSPKV
ncbi:hypothetical protein CPB84DRAFT_1853144 [Gymnopilus junonius]|uniref:Uncharacterized protein n=1 Tax=Gymnopilus junonius TaxID=109634 RepID=A0A9P5N952_GYMJU|nr:hypothetical protein CPB84DRAFT_1853144 [Gymnopilus junonius]